MDCPQSVTVAYPTADRSIPILERRLWLQTPNLAFDLSYAYYDAKTKKNLGFGSVTVMDDFTFAMTKSNWENNMKKTAAALLKSTPLLKK
jgi:hypothetical protein